MWGPLSEGSFGEDPLGDDTGIHARQSRGVYLPASELGERGLGSIDLGHTEVGGSTDGGSLGTSPLGGGGMRGLSDRQASYNRQSQAFWGPSKVAYITAPTASIPMGESGEIPAFRGSSDRVATFSRLSSGVFSGFRVNTVRALTMVRDAEGYFIGPFHGGSDLTSPNWQINGRQAPEAIEEERTWTHLTITFRSKESIVEEVLHQADGSAGSFNVIERSDGSYSVIDRADKASEIELTPPDGRERLRTVEEWAVDEYQEEISDQSADIYEIDVTFIGMEPKPSGDYDTVEVDDAEWHFEFADGDVSTSRIEHNVGRGGSSIDGSKQISMPLTFEEAMVVEDSLNRQASVATRKIPDAQNMIEDNNPDSRNTVFVTSPAARESSEQVLEGGEYVVEDWDNSLINDERFQFNLTLTPVN